MRTDPALVAALTESVLPNSVAIAARDPRLIPVTIEPSEGVAVARAVPARVAEFHAGRAAARAAMVVLGMPPHPIPMGPDRAPIWPQGLTGSISHTAQSCVSAVGLTSDWVGIGIDLEEATPLDPLLVTQICTRSEQVWLGQQPPADRGLMAKLIFSAKEAAYKAQYPQSGTLFGFDVMELTVNRKTCSFEAEFLQTKGPFGAGTRLAGSYVHAAGLLVTGVAIGRAEFEMPAGG
ncbi:MAG: 4'-phosphopantetheinyl transferase superfamily protein [Sulfitobacter sp.]